MNCVFLGPPGAGKGTHAQRISARYGLQHLATGDILRRNLREGTELGLKAKSVMEKGELVSDDIINAMMFGEIQAAQDKKGVILDGYPRTLGQAEAMKEFFEKQGMKLDVVINFVTSEEVIIKRLTGRQSCPKCGKVYHTTNLPPRREGVCDEDGEKLVSRKDDEPETIRRRLSVYHRETAPLIDFYKSQGNLKEVPGDGSVEEVQKHLAVFFESCGSEIS